MRRAIQRALKRGVDVLREHPQLWLTILVAVAIFVSFAYVSNRFITIARDAQERLVNVRVGALQDAFAPLAAAFLNDAPALRMHMLRLAELNPTIVDFVLVVPSGSEWTILVSLAEAQTGTKLLGYDFLLSLAEADPARSFTIEEARSGERFFRTARAVTSAEGDFMGIALTRQTLSEADRSIANSIRSGLYVLVGILALLLFLFFHHARIIDYTALYRRLQEVDHLKDDFLSMASHELRTPLTVIRGYVDELKGAFKPEDTAHAQLLQRIDQSASALTALIADMLDVARLQQGRMSFTFSTVDPKLLIMDVCDSLQVKAREKKLSLECAVENAKIRIDPERMRQVLVNLVGNAIKYSDAGTISVRGTIEQEYFVLRVSDTGIGMTADEQTQLFSKFYRAGEERIRKETGTGLGLWITKQLVEAMSGHIAVESIKGVGSHFILSFPLATK